jgi:uncharacterized membrane protein
LVTVTIYAFFAGVAAILVGLRIINLGLTTQSILSGLGFILSGLGGVCATPALLLAADWDDRTGSSGFDLGIDGLCDILGSSG